MKQLLYSIGLIGLLLNGISLQAQEKEIEKKQEKTLSISIGVKDSDSTKPEGADEDTVTFHWGDRTIMIFKNPFHVVKGDTVKMEDEGLGGRWSGIDFGINGFINSDGSTDLSHGALSDPKKVTNFMEVDYRHSWMFRFNFLELNLRTKNERLGMLTGMGLEWNNYELKNNVRLIHNGGHFVNNNVTPFTENYTWGVADTGVDFSKNRFKTFTLNVPLMVELNMGREKDFYITAGAILGLNVRSKMKYKYSGSKEKLKGDMNVNPFRASLSAKVGYKNFGLFATYGLTSMFQNNKGPEVYPFSVGVTLVNF